MNFPHNEIKINSIFIDDVLEINDQSRCILSGPPCIGLFYLCDDMLVVITQRKWVALKIVDFTSVLFIFLNIVTIENSNAC